MRGRGTFTIVAAVVALAGFSPVAHAGPIFLDMDTPATGSLLGTAPLVTPFGGIGFVGEFRVGDPSDPEFIAAGASGNTLDIRGDSTAWLGFGFDVSSISFIYGGNSGSFLAEAWDIDGNVIDSFFQASTADGQPAGPETLRGSGIRNLFWRDTSGGQFAAIDNITIEAGVASVPEPTSLLLFGTGLAGLRAWRKRRG